MRTAGGMIPGGWNERDSEGVIDGTWELTTDNSRATGLTFSPSNPFTIGGFLLISAADVRRAHRIKAGINVAYDLEIDGQQTVGLIGPRGRIKTMIELLTTASATKLGPESPRPTGAVPPPPPPPRKSKAKWIVLAIVLTGALLAVGGVIASNSARDNRDAATMAEIRSNTHEWNDILGPVVADYLDPNVAAEDWVAEAGPVIGELEPLIRAIGDLAADLSDSELRGLVMELASNYQHKLAAFSALVNAVNAGDTEAETSAQEDLQEATDEALEIAGRLPDLE